MTDKIIIKVNKGLMDKFKEYEPEIEKGISSRIKRFCNRWNKKLKEVGVNHTLYIFNDRDIWQTTTHHEKQDPKNHWQNMETTDVLLDQELINRLTGVLETGCSKHNVTGFINQLMQAAIIRWHEIEDSQSGCGSCCWD